MTLLKHSPLAIEFRPNGKRVHPNGRSQLLAWIRTSCEVGVTSWDARAAGLSNPSQYGGDIVADGTDLMFVVELPPHGGPASKGVRWFLPEHAPAGALPVKRSADRHPQPVVVEPEPVRPAPARRKPAAPSDIGDLFALADPIDISYSDDTRKAA